MRMMMMNGDGNKITNLQKYREKRGLTKYQLAKNTGVSLQHITNIEAGITKIDNVSVGIARKLAKELKLRSVNSLFDD